MAYEFKDGYVPRIERAKGVHFNYLQFLWKRLERMHTYAEKGEFALAIEMLILASRFFPSKIKNAMRNFLDEVEAHMDSILNGEIPQLKDKKYDDYTRSQLIHQYLQWYCREVYMQLTDWLSDKLEEQGLLESGKEAIPKGISHTIPRQGEIIFEDEDAQLEE